MPVALNGERMELVELLERAAELGMQPRRRDRRPHRGPDRRPEGARHLRGAGGGDPAQGAPRARAPVRHDPPEPVQARARPEVGLPRLRRPVVGAAADRPRGLHPARQRARDRARSGSSCTRARRASSRARARTRSTTPSWRRSPSRAGCSPSSLARASSSCGRCSPGWLTGCGTGRTRPCSTSCSACSSGTAARSSCASSTGARTCPKRGARGRRPRGGRRRRAAGRARTADG